jgi:hypothetical protein
LIPLVSLASATVDLVATISLIASPVLHTFGSMTLRMLPFPEAFTLPFYIVVFHIFS